MGEKMNYKEVIFVCPYVNEHKSAAAVYISDLAEYIASYTKVIVYVNTHIYWLSAKLEQRYLPEKKLGLPWITKALGVTLLLAELQINGKEQIIISDYNPCICIARKSNRFLHIIHHTNDIPSLSIVMEKFLGNKPVVKVLYNTVSTLLWQWVLVFSPKEIITVSNSVKTEIKNINDSKRISVIRNCNHLEAVAMSSFEEAKQMLQYDIIMIGNNIPRKNYLVAIEAIAKIEKMMECSLKVNIVGANSGLLPRLFPKSCTVWAHEDIDILALSYIIRASRVFLHTANQEGYCKPYIECQSFGLTCVVPNQPVFHENQFTNDIYFADMNVECISKQLIKAITNSYRMYKRHFDRKSCIDLTLSKKIKNENIRLAIDKVILGKVKASGEQE